jgi:phage gp29-like protein
MPDYITTKQGLLIPTAAFEEAVAAKPELREIASIERDWTKQFFGQVLRNDDDTLLTRGGGKGLKIYDELERDAHAYAELQKRKLAVVARPWDITPASDAAEDVAVAEMVRELFKRLQFDRICMELLDATLKGFAVGEVMWEVIDSREHGGLVGPADVIARDQRRFAFTKERALRLLTEQQMIEGEELPERKFIVHRHGAKDGSPYGLGLGHRLFWPVFFKRQDIGFWLTFADKFGSPTAIGKYPKGANDAEQKKLLAMLRRIANDVGIIVPEGTEVELLEAARAGSIDTYEKLARYMDEQVSKAVNGGTMTTTSQAAGLGSGQAEVHDEGRIEIARADADLLSDTLNNTLVRWVVEYNRPGAALPKVWRSFEEEEDLGQRAERDQKISLLGFEPTEEYITETYGPGWKKKPAAPPPAVPGAPGTDPAQFAEGAPAQRAAHRDVQDAIIEGAETLAADWQQLLGKRVEELLAFAEETGDLVTFRERLAELLDADPPQEVVDAIARAGFASALAGRAGPALQETSAASFAERLLSFFRPRRATTQMSGVEAQPLHLHVNVDARQGPVTKEIVIKKPDGTELRAEATETTK